MTDWNMTPKSQNLILCPQNELFAMNLKFVIAPRISIQVKFTSPPQKKKILHINTSYM